MSLNLHQDKAFLELLDKTKPLQQRALLITATPSQIHTICECVINVLHGTVPLTTANRNALIPYRNILYTLAEPTIPYADKKRFLVQEGGGFIDQLLPVILPALRLLI